MSDLAETDIPRVQRVHRRPPALTPLPVSYDAQRHTRAQDLVDLIDHAEKTGEVPPDAHDIIMRAIQAAPEAGTRYLYPPAKPQPRVIHPPPRTRAPK